MSDRDISPNDPYPRDRIGVLGHEMAYIDAGKGDPIVFLHGNPTRSYLWRNIIPHVEGQGRCLAPDLIGMGESDRIEGCGYTFADHARYLDAWFEALDLKRNVILVMHDWGSGLGFHWANRHRDAVQGLAYMEAIVKPVTWDDWPDNAREIFQALRSEAGEKLVLEKNIFVERILPASVKRTLGEEEMTIYREPYLEPGETRRPTLTWPRMIPIEGEPEEVARLVEDYGRWLENSDIPKLFVNGDPGSILTGAQREFCRGWNNQKEVTVDGLHFLQEDSPHEIGAALSDFISNIRQGGNGT